jgi:hypothetical protein
VAAAAGRSAAAQRPSPRTVTLINGDRVVVAGSGARFQADAVAPAANGSDRTLISLDVAGQAYEIPAGALPYLGRGLSPSLFEVGSLLDTESGGRLPVQVSYQGSVPELLGVTITRSGGGTAQGYLTAASAAAFGAALVRQLAADHARGSYGTDGIFAGGMSIGLPGQAGARLMRPDYPMHTLTVTGTSLAGRPDTGDQIEVVNIDNANSFSNPDEIFSVFDRGVAKFSVPAGHYVAFGIFDALSGSTISGYRMVTLPQFTVARNTTVAVAERAADDQVQIVTPRPAITQDLTLTVQRGMADGSAFSQQIDAGTLPLWTNVTTGPVTVGTLDTVTTAYLTSPPRTRHRYEYDLAFAGTNGQIDPQRHVVTASSLATVHANYYQDGASTGGWDPAPIFEFQIVGGILIDFSDVFPFLLPQSETQYTSASPSLFWLDSYYQSITSPTPSPSGGQFDVPRMFAPGERTTLDWNAYPLHPGPSVNLLGTANPIPLLPTASRAASTLTLDIAPFGDNTPGHTGAWYSAAGSYELDQNGKKIASGSVASGAQDLFLQTALGSEPATIRFVLTATRTGGLYRLSTGSRTVWTWRTEPEPGAVLPGGWVCATATRSCAVQPMMTLLYQVHGLGLHGSAPAGRQRIVITAGHLQLAPAAAVTAMGAAVSVNDGRTWQPAPVTPLGGGRFAAAFTAPPGAYVSLRVQAADAAGDSIAETITRGYQTAP